MRTVAQPADHGADGRHQAGRRAAGRRGRSGVGEARSLPRAAYPAYDWSGSKACFQSRGDKIWIKDDGRDGHSAVAVWHHYLGDGAYRNGVCRNRLGAGRWGVCNKELSEDSYFEFWAAEYDAETRQWLEWSKSNSAIS